MNAEPASRIYCDALVVHRMGDRLQKIFPPWIPAQFGPDNFDIISIAGAVLEKDTVIKYVRLAVQMQASSAFSHA